MNRNLLHIIIFSIILFIYIICMFIYGLRNITLYNILLFLFASPILEEFIFRRLLQNNLNKIIKYSLFPHISTANIISSFIFAISHLFTENAFFVTIILFITSLYLGLIYDKYKSIKYTIAAHSLLNIMVFINFPNHIWQFIMKINLLL